MVFRSLFRAALMRRTFSRLRPFVVPFSLATGMGIATAFGKGDRKAEIHEDIQELHHHFWGNDVEPSKVRAIGKHASTSCPSGGMCKTRFVRAFNDLGVRDDKAIEFFFDGLSKDKYGCVSFNDFIASIAIIGKPHTNPVDKLQFVIHCCDDGNGKISKHKLRDVLRSLMDTRERYVVAEVKPTWWSLTFGRFIASASTPQEHEPKIDENQPLWVRSSQIGKMANKVDLGKDVRLKGSNYREGISKLSADMADRISINVSGEVSQDLSIKELCRWAKRGDREAQFLTSLCEGGEIGCFTHTTHYLDSCDSVYMLDGTTVM
mmetsp:Transcript_16722/g.25159  ORF Transcript_16722/g.25159 Transcript_16722/m.25159 type:complete len:320 (+) Transcript_16722:97-1056(+)